jgi:hypothetical protein
VGNVQFSTGMDIVVKAKNIHDKKFDDENFSIF